MEFPRPLRFGAETPERKSQVIKELASETHILGLENDLRDIHIEYQEKEAGIDHLTGAKVRRVLEHELDLVLRVIRGETKERRDGEGSLKRAALIFIDIDKFKQVNDTYGHDEGDRVLKKIAVLLQGALREVDMLARYGGDEFVVLLPNATEQNALRIGEKLRATLDNDVELKRHEVTASIGVCSTDVSTATDTENFIKHADGAAYVAKRAGGNRVEVYV